MNENPCTTAHQGAERIRTAESDRSVETRGTRPYIDDADFQLYVGDVREVLASLPAASVHCVVTSPPYFGLRDYSCDGQIGLELTLDAYVQTMVAVFREVRRVMRTDATLWLNLGDAFGSKQMLGMPWKVAFALQADGWYLRADVIWSKPNPMPESVTDRPTKAHEYLFLLTRSPRYFYDADAIREPLAAKTLTVREGPTNYAYANDGGGHVKTANWNNSVTERRHNHAGANKRSVWEIATEPYPDAHFATFPQALVEPCVLAGTSERGCCPVCGASWERETSTEYDAKGRTTNGPRSQAQRHETAGFGQRLEKRVETTGWRPTCEHDHEPAPCTVADIFMGSGTTALVARRLGRNSIGIELNSEYARLCADRLKQLSLLAVSR
jgi:DNA modification methylase